MDNTLKNLIDETLDEFFDNTSTKMVETGIREEKYEVCPHCKKEIYERHEYTEDGGQTWRHADCKGLITRPQTLNENIIGQEFRLNIKGQEFKAVTNPYAGGFRSVAFLPDGKQVASFTHDTKEGAEMDLYKQLQTKFVGESVDGMPPSGEEKYNKQEPGGTMSAANTTTIANEASKGVTEKEEVKPLPPNDFVRFMGNMMSIVNMSKVPLKITVTEFSAMADEVNSVKTYNIHIDNG